MCPDKKCVLVSFSFESNTSGNPASSTFKGDLLLSVVRSAAGKWTCTLTDGAYDVIGGWVCPQISSGTDGDFTGYLGAIDLAAKTVVAYVRKGGTADDMIAADRINVFLVLKNSRISTRRS